MVQMERYHHLLIRQLMSLTGYRDRKYVEESVRQLANAGYLSNLNYLQKRVRLGDTSRGGAQPSIVSLRQPKGKMDFEHVIALNDALIAMELFPVYYGQGQLLALIHDLDLHVSMHGAPVIPDGYVAYQWHELNYGFAIELDRGTEDYNDPKQSGKWLSKISGYLSLMRGNPPAYQQYFPYESLRVAVVVKSGFGRTKPSHLRMRDLVHWTERAIDELGYAPGWGQLFRFTTADAELVSPEEFVLGNHWTVPYTYQEVSLLPTEGLEGAPI